MKTFLISYDLLRPGQNYPSLIAELRRSGAVQVLMSGWLLKSGARAIDIINALTVHVDRNDKVLVTEVGADAAWTMNIDTIVLPMW